MKNLCNVFLGYLGGWIFHNFPSLLTMMQAFVCVGEEMERGCGDSQHVLEFLRIVKYSIQALYNI